MALVQNYKPIAIAAAALIALSAYWLTRSGEEAPATTPEAAEPVGATDDGVEDRADDDRRAPPRALSTRAAGKRGEREVRAGDQGETDSEGGDEPERGDERERDDTYRRGHDRDGPTPEGVEKRKAWSEERARKLQDVKARIAKVEKRAGELEAAGDIPGHDKANEELGRLHRQREALEEDQDR